jgi:hypothetical protein
MTELSCREGLSCIVLFATICLHRERWMIVECGLRRATDLFSLRRRLAIALHTRMCVSYHPWKATDYGHTNLLFFTHLLWKNIGHRSSQSQRSEPSDRSSELGGPFAQLAFRLFFLLQLFFPDEKKILKCNPAKQKKGRARVDYPIPTANRSMDELSCDQS